jgi:hypothetical protein
VVFDVIVCTSFSPVAIAPDESTSKPGFFSHTTPTPPSTSNLGLR